MTHTIRHRLCRLTAAAAGLILFSAAPTLAQNTAAPCSAFTRNADGSWKVLAPVMLSIDGRLLGPTVGSIFVSGSTINGIKLSKVLDYECG
jgi:hypothetical protein